MSATKSRAWLLNAIFLCLFAAGGYGIWYGFFSSSPNTNPDPENTERETDPDHVTLTSEKISAAGIKLDTVQKQTLQPVITVNGRLQYDDNLHVEIKPGNPGVIRDLLVKPGDRVKKGDLLATLSSPEIGAARADLLKRQKETEQAAEIAKWQNESIKNIKLLITTMQSEIAPEKLEQQIQQVTIGEAREKLTSHYNQLRLTLQNYQRGKQIGVDILTEKVLRERETEYLNAKSSLQALCEQTLFDLRRLEQTAQLNLEDATRRLEIARQQLTSLLGYAEDSAIYATNAEKISLLEIKAPLDGMIEQRLFSVTERVQAQDILFILANPEQLWVEADVRESNWQNIRVQPGEHVTVEIPALANAKFQAEIYYVGREVSATALAIPVIATLKNPEGTLRPGLFARVALPSGPQQQILAVPQSAVTQHAKQQLAFVPAGTNQYRKIILQTGPAIGEWVPILSGIGEGDQIVTQGVFTLKSEMLLERE